VLFSESQIKTSLADFGLATFAHSVAGTLCYKTTKWCTTLFVFCVTSCALCRFYVCAKKCTLKTEPCTKLHGRTWTCTGMFRLPGGNTGWHFHSFTFTLLIKFVDWCHRLYVEKQKFPWLWDRAVGHAIFFENLGFFHKILVKLTFFNQQQATGNRKP